MTLGHITVLRGISSPYVVPGEIGITDTLIAALVCANPWRDSERMFHKWWFTRLVSLWGWRCRKMNMTTESLKFTAYLNEQFAFPRTTGTGGGSLRSPFIYRIITELTSKLGMPYGEALDTPLLRANALLVAYLEQNGKIEFESRAEEERKIAFRQFAAEMDRKKFGGAK